MESLVFGVKALGSKDLHLHLNPEGPSTQIIRFQVPTSIL